MIKPSNIAALRVEDELSRNCGGKFQTAFVQSIDEKNGTVTISFNNGNERTLSFAYLMSSGWEVVQ